MLLHMFLQELTDVQAVSMKIWIFLGLAFSAGPLHYLYAKYLIHQDTFLKLCSDNAFIFKPEYQPSDFLFSKLK